MGESQAAMALLILGCALVFVGSYIQTLDFGSCPMIRANSTNLQPCYHTFPGTNIYIAPTGNAVFITGSVLIAVALAILSYSRIRRSATHL